MQAATVSYGGQLALAQAFANAVTLAGCPGLEDALLTAGVGVVRLGTTRSAVSRL